MYHTLKNTLKNKELRTPKGWIFSGDTSFLRLTNSNFKTFFMVVNKRMEFVIKFNPSLMPKEKYNEWKVEECYKDSSIVINLGDDLSEIECKNIAIKQARRINRSSFSNKLLWIIISVILGAIGSLIIKMIVSKLFKKE